MSTASFDIVILIPHYNDLTGLLKSVKSVKTKIKTLILIVDDGSCESERPSPDLVLCDARSNIAIKIIFCDVNEGIEKVLNIGLAYIIGNLSCGYVARLDCGDICMPHRFDRQIEYMDNNPHVMLSGTWAEVVDDEGKYWYTLKPPVSYESIKRRMNVRIAFVHPTIIMRHTLLKSGYTYPLGFKTAEDYAFLFDIVTKYYCTNIPEVLLTKVNSVKSISSLKRKDQIKARIRVIFHYGRFSLTFLYGILRTSILLLIPYTIMEKAKHFLLK